MDSFSMALVDSSQEFFYVDNKLVHLTNGRAKDISDFPGEFKNLLTEELASDQPAQRGLDKMGIKNSSDRLNKFFHCNYSLYDNTPDVTSCGKLGNREFIKCPGREHCKGEGEVCKFPNSLTKRQAQVARRVALSHMDAEICFELNISQNTLRNHKNNIEQKIGLDGKVAIGVWASQSGII